MLILVVRHWLFVGIQLRSTNGEGTNITKLKRMGMVEAHIASLGSLEQKPRYERNGQMKDQVEARSVAWWGRRKVLLASLPDLRYQICDSQNQVACVRLQTAAC